MILLWSNTIHAQDTTAYINSAEVIRAGIELHDAEEYDRALEYYQLVSPSDTNYAWSLSEQVLTHTTQQNYDEAIRLAQQGLGLQSQYKASFYDMLGTAYDYNDEVEKALSTYKAGIERYPYYQILLYNYGVTLKKDEQYEQAEQYFIRRLELDPFSANSHLQLAELSVLQGYRAKALMSYIMYMALRPSDLKTIDKIQDLLIDTIKEEGSISTYSPNPFGEADALIRSKFATRKKFKPSVDIDYRVTRQAEVLIKKLSYDQNSDDFWMQFYVPFFEGVKEQKLLPALLYSIMSGVKKDEISSWIEKNSKKVEQLQSLAQEVVLASALYHTTTVLGQENLYRYWYFDGGALNAIGNSNEEGTDIGPYIYFYANGEVSAKGVLDMAGNKVGKWSYYEADGSLSSEETYDQQGNLIGESVNYYSSGATYSTVPYENGVATGLVKVYYECGELQETYYAANNQINGEGRIYDTEGNNTAIYQMVNGSLTGPYQEFYPTGEKAGTYNYKEGQLDGKFVSYHKNGQVKEQGDYTAGQIDGSWQGFFEDGTMEYEVTYQGGSQTGKSTFYHKTGEKSMVSNYADGKANGDYLAYDEDGVLHYKYIYRDNLLTGYEYYDKGGKILSQGASEDTLKLTGYTPDGHLQFETTYIKGVLNGLMTQYYPNGNVYYTINTVDGEWEGTYNEYHKTGEVSLKTTYTDGANTGWYQTYFKNGQLASEGMVVNGSLEQRYTTYYPDGTKESVAWYLNGEIQGQNFNYTPTGLLFSLEEYETSVPVKLTQYDSTGHVSNTSVLKAGDGKHIVKAIDGTIKLDKDFSCGKETGSMTYFYGKDEVDSHYTMENGQYHGPAQVYHTNGQLYSEGNFKDGKMDSLWVWYDPLGNVTSKTWYENGTRNGTDTYYYANGQIESQCNYVNGEQQGDCKYYSHDGSLQYIKTYDKDYGIVGYKYELPGGKMTELKPVDITGTTTVTAYFANKQKSVQQQYKKGLFDGKSTFYYSNGQIQDEIEFKNGENNGWARSYYPNGNLKSETHYLNDLRDGLSKWYKEDGTLLQAVEYKQGVKNGYETWYNADGTVARKLLFWNNVIY
jgi:antitoxin component YwqK of YwqJK toxin-antitoxin module/Tfp pilus assembly protein PilF